MRTIFVKCELQYISNSFILGQAINWCRANLAIYIIACNQQRYFALFKQSYFALEMNKVMKLGYCYISIKSSSGNL